MITVSAERLRVIARDVFSAVGCVPDDAAFVADSLVAANLMGHDSHGVIRIPQYVGEVKAGNVVPANRPEIIQETANTALVSGNWTFGQVACRYATGVAIAKAKQANVALVGVVKCNHNGRLGEYVSMAAREGLIAMMTQGGDRGPRGVVPFGGMESILATNPYAFGVPAGGLPTFVADFATATVASGKIAVARAKGEDLAPGLIVDKDGHPTTKVEDFYSGGNLLPAAGHKGYALAVLSELLGGFLMGGDIYGNEVRSTAVFLLVINPAAFRPTGDYTRVVEQRLRTIKASRPAPGLSEVLIPGEPEVRTQALREREGIALAEDTWERILKTCRELGVQVDQ